MSFHHSFSSIFLRLQIKSITIVVIIVILGLSSVLCIRFLMQKCCCIFLDITFCNSNAFFIWIIVNFANFLQIMKGSQRYIPAVAGTIGPAKRSGWCLRTSSFRDGRTASTKNSGTHRWCRTFYESYYPFLRSVDFCAAQTSAHMHPKNKNLIHVAPQWPFIVWSVCVFAACPKGLQVWRNLSMTTRNKSTVMKFETR